MTEFMGELLASLLIVAGSFFLLVGSWGWSSCPP
jgi:hypothetical protein